MKILKIRFALPVLLGTALFWTSCQKDGLNQSSGNQTTEPQFMKASGVVEDDDAAIAKVPLIVSSAYLASNGRLASTYGEFLKGRNVTDRTAPTVSITSPANGATVTGTVNVTVNASDNVGVKSVSLTVDGAVVSTNNFSPFTNSWNSATVANGSHSLSVTASDAAGNKATSTITVSVNNVAGDFTSPSVAITSPANNSAFDPNVTVTINVSSSDNVGVSSINVSVDGTVIGTKSGSSGSFSWNTGTTSGLHTITAKAFDAAGNQGSSSVTVTVNTTVIITPTLPSSVLLSTPPVQYQGSEGACVTFATLYGRDVEQYYKSGASVFSTASNILSPEYVYNQTKASTSCSSGSSLINTLNFLVNNGVCTWNSMPFSDQNGCTTLPTSAQTTEAANYRIKSYSMVLGTDISGIKTMLFNKHPLTFTFTADANFYNYQAGTVWSSYSSTFYGPHAVTIIGYDDSKKAYKAINQWGTTWGDQGYVWIDYTFLSTITYDLYVQNL
ncbi:MAG: Ig-like domain-containing protein [Sphingobacteriales bacterium]